jgi:primosomal protein N' (replication factor Y)
VHHTLALLSPPYASLSYSAPDYLPEDTWLPGLRAAVPLGAGALRAAVVLGRNEEGRPDGLRMKHMCWPLEARPLFDAPYMEMIRQTALRQGVTPGYILGHVLPRGLRAAQARLRRFGDGGPRIVSLRTLMTLPRAELEKTALAWTRGEAEILPPRADAAAGEC